MARKFDVGQEVLLRADDGTFPLLPRAVITEHKSRSRTVSVLYRGSDGMPHTGVFNVDDTRAAPYLTTPMNSPSV